MALLLRFVGSLLALVMLPAVSLAQSGTAPVTAPPVIAAANNLQFAIEELAEAFRAETGQMVRLAMGSSGNASRQIRQGAPFELFLSADEDYVLDLARDGFTRDEGIVYAIGRLAIVTPKNSPLKADGTLQDLAVALADGRLTRFAIANPEHAPYGQRAVEALRHKGLWQAIEPKLVYGENIAQAAQFALSGNAQGGLVAYALALTPQARQAGAYALVPQEYHSPLRQRMALTKKAGPAAERFYAYLQTPPARAIFRKYGFLLPGESG